MLEFLLLMRPCICRVKLPGPFMGPMWEMDGFIPASTTRQGKHAHSGPRSSQAENAPARSRGRHPKKPPGVYRGKY